MICGLSIRGRSGEGDGTGLYEFTAGSFKGMVL